MIVANTVRMPLKIAMRDGCFTWARCCLMVPDFVPFFGARLEDALRTRRPVWFGGWRDTPVYVREKLPLDAVIEGPAILEQLDATTVLEPGDTARSDRDGNLIVEVGQIVEVGK